MTDKIATLPSLLHGMFYAIETSRNFACGRKMFEYKYISILNVSKLKQENANSQCFRAEVWIWKHKLWDWVIHSPATPTPRPYPDYSKLPDFYRLPGTKTPTSGRKPDDYQPRAQIKQMFQEGKLKAGDKKAIKEFSEKIHCFRKACCRFYLASNWYWNTKR